ncbi:MAG: 50S ribosomal protein L11 methyltransferase [Chloroflexota bacterium]
MRWLELASRVDGEAVEAVSEVFSRVASGGVVVEPDVSPGSDDGFAVGPLATVRAYVPLDPETAGKQRTVEEALWHLRAIWPVGELTTREVDEEDWANAWKKHYSVFRIGRRIVIRPSWLDYVASPDDVIVSIDPGVAFGTGLHPTTRRCLEAIEDALRPGDEVLDVGTGSGILALAAAALGARRVIATDVDPVAVSAARANVARGALADRIQVIEGSATAVAARPEFGVVVANIIARVILDLAPDLVARLRPDGVLVVGGIIADRADEVARELARLGLEATRLVDGDWSVFVARRSLAS